jgi:hypothetical protein
VLCDNGEKKQEKPAPTRTIASRMQQFNPFCNIYYFVVKYIMKSHILEANGGRKGMRDEKESVDTEQSKSNFNFRLSQ